MIPSLVVRDVDEGLRSYIKSEFPVASEGFINKDGKTFLEEYLDKPDSLTKGPWVEIKLPFRQVGEDVELPFETLDIKKLIPGFNPYEHQRNAFMRLCGINAQSTIVATGTGSGKTECFLLPIIDYCLTNRKPGIKAILIYPMNALATDQAKRVMQLINKIPNAPIRAGIYTGESEEKKTVVTQPGEIISNRYELRNNPPDILLTNYKMLDFLLMRPEDQGLWNGNGPDILKYLVVDELHTFDGAQGTDLSCLIRRLRDRLHLKDSLVCIGTSATIGGPESVKELCQYASSVFASEFDSECVIQEDRLSAKEFLQKFNQLQPKGQWPGKDFLSVEESSMSVASYLAQVIPYWFNESLGFDGSDISESACIRLASELPCLEGFKRLIRSVHGVTDLGELVKRWEHEIPELKELSEDQAERRRLIKAIINSLIAMTAVSRLSFKGRTIPFLNVRSQLWIRTLSRAVVSVGKEPKLALANDLPNLKTPLYLPVIGCRECNNVAWACTIEGGLKKQADERVIPDLKKFYECWFKEHPDIVLMYPVTDEKIFNLHISEIYRICPGCGQLSFAGQHEWKETAKDLDFQCSCNCQDTVIVWIPKTTIKSTRDGAEIYKFKNICPHCLSSGSLRIFGAASSSLSAATIDHLHASSFNSDNKIIAFSDSVQDAALRAGFFDARNFIPTCRHALVHYLIEKGKNSDISLKEVLNSLPGYWVQKFGEKFEGKNKEILGKAAFLATFIAPDKEWMISWKTFNEAAQKSYSLKSVEGTVENNSSLVESFQHWENLFEKMKERLTWEALMEIGFRSENGRTVARAELAIAFPNPDLIKKAAISLVNRLKDEYRITTSVEKMGCYLAGFLHQMQLVGAFDVGNILAPTIRNDFGKYQRSGEAFSCFNKSLVLPSFGKFFRAPTAVTYIPCPKDDFNVSLYGKKTWFMSWLIKILVHDYVFVKSHPQDLILLTMNVLSDVGLVKCIERSRDNTKAWILPIEHWKVGQNVRKWRCNCCGRKYFSSDRKTVPLWTKMPCHSPECPGLLEEDTTDGRNFLYQSPPVRINAREHTSLIDSDNRKLIENNFSTTDYPWSVNLLSATPTLEMGIDIGDLSTVLLCSLPPQQANYLQRIGRAGRRDGNAVALTMVDKSSHDLYFWQDPNEMLQGKVGTPGIFLRAEAVLERQLLAFALGRWVSTTEPLPKIPEKLHTALKQFESKKIEVFPQNFLCWVSDNRNEILNGFLTLFKNDLNGETTEALQMFLEGDGIGERLGLVERLNRSFRTAQASYENFNRKIKELKKIIKSLEDAPKDDNTKNKIEELYQQKENYQNLIKSCFSEKLFFNFLTDEGLLPNYAFPEEGIQVKSVIFLRRGKKEDKKNGASKPAVETFEFSRAAGSALKELSPSSHFYVKEHILHVDQVNITQDSFEKWRFCPSCSYSEKVDATVSAPHCCPRCGSTLFNDGGQEKTLLRIREITAIADAKKDLISDDREERKREPQTCQVLIDVDRENDVDSAWQIKDNRFNFGFEFLRRVTVREINFGPSLNVNNSLPFKVSGMKIPQFGFKICKHCGKVYKKDKPQHDVTCPCYGKAEDPDDSPWIDGLFLYREVKSEAIRIRIPVCDMVDLGGAEIGTNSFIAAIKLGLRKYFKGAVDHLAVCIQTEPIPNSSEGRNRYIVIYDTIPGGSGYLKDLARIIGDSGKPEIMLSMFRAAYDAVRFCQCTKDLSKDGCYHCVYQYRDYGTRTEISRKEAEGILEKITSYGPEQLEKIKSISDIESLDMSVLEKSLIKRLSVIPDNSFNYRPSKTGEMRYEIEVPLSEEVRNIFKERIGRDPGRRFKWTLEAQPDFTKGDKQSRPDFVIRPLDEFVSSRFPELTSYIFTDGWEYHASILSDDTAKRQAILNEGNRVWSLTWQDIAHGKGQSEGNNMHFSDTLLFKSQEIKRRWNGTFGKNSDDFDSAENNVNEILKQTSMDWLQEWLSDPFGFSNRMGIAIRFALMTHKELREPKTEDKRIPSALFEAQDETDSSQTKAKVVWLTANHITPFEQVTNVIQQADKSLVVATAIRIQSQDFANSQTLESNELHERWAKFWQCANAVQFIDRAWICTNENEEEIVYRRFYQPEKLTKVSPSTTQPCIADSEWIEFIRDLEDDDKDFYANVIDIAKQLMVKHIPVCELVDGFGDKVICSGKGLMWTVNDEQIFLFASEDVENEADLSTEEYFVVTTSEPDWLMKIENALIK